jgi:hypothetical protein
MEPLVIQETKATPEVKFLLNGELSIKGRSLPEDPHGFYNPLLEWIIKSTLESIRLEIKMEYMNTSSYKQIFNFLTYLKDNTYAKKVNIDWFYEEGDDDGFEIGKEFEVLTAFPFTFHEYAEVLS